jgi:beta-N-acetylhexosaminidase
VTLPSTPPTCSNATVIARWPVARRAAQLVAVPVFQGQSASVSVAVNLQAGGILLIGSVPGAASLKTDLQAATGDRPGPAPMVMADEEGGGVQRLVPDVNSLPWPRQMAATMTPGQVEQAAAAVAAQMKALGVTVDLAPVLDLDGGAQLTERDPDGPRSFSTVPATAASYGIAFAKGLAAGGVVAVVKHFPGLGQASGNTDYGAAQTRPIAQLRAAGLLPFAQAIGSEVRAVMVANATVPGLTSRPASVSSAVITGLLRDQMHFGGLVMTDSLTAGAISSAGYSVPDAAVASIEAGADMVLFGSTLTPAETAQLAPGPLQAETRAILTAITQAVSAGTLPEERLDQAVVDVLKVKGVNLCS